jgi:SAM-dependent methyltransferase
MGEFSRRPDAMLALQQSRAAALAEELVAFVDPRGDERVLDVGTGTGALAFALAGAVREVVAVDPAADLLAAARPHAPANVRLVEADGTQLPFGRGEFDVTASLRVLHHVARPELVLAELTRVTRPGGTVVVVDQLGDVDPLVAVEIDRFERARDRSHTRLLPDGDLRALFEANGLVLERARRVAETRELDAYLELAGCTGAAAAPVRALAPSSPYRIEVGWYLLRRP